MIRRIAGGVLILAGLWICYGAGSTLGAYVSRGGDLMTSLLDPVFLFRFIGGIGALIGGGLAALNTKGGAWLATIGLIAFGAFTALLVLNDPFGDMSTEELYMSAVLAVPTLALLVLKRRT